MDRWREVVVGLQIASVSRDRNFSGRIVARSFHNACRAQRNALCDAAASPDVLIRREREKPIEEEEAAGCGEEAGARRTVKDRTRERPGVQWEREAFSL